MAEFTTVEKINLLLKMVYGIQGLSNTDDANGLKWFNEKYSWNPTVKNSDIYASAIPTASSISIADANVTANPTIIEKRDITLTPVTGTNGRAWIAYKTVGDAASGIYDDWLTPQIFGTGYAMRLFKDNGSGGLGAEITTTEGAWIPAYKLGAIVLASGNTASDLSWTTPLHAQVYRYTGPKGIGGATAHVSLDDAYNEGTVITIDSVPIAFNAEGSIAPLQVTPIAYTPSSSLADGQVCNRNGVLYMYDTSRTKWISIEKPCIAFSANKGDANYLSADINSGYIALRNGTIIGIAAVGGAGNTSKEFSIRKNGDESDLTVFNLSNSKFYSDIYNIDFNAGDVLQVYCSATGTAINAPVVQVYIAWRI